MHEDQYQTHHHQSTFININKHKKKNSFSLGFSWTWHLSTKVEGSLTSNSPCIICINDVDFWINLSGTDLIVRLHILSFYRRSDHVSKGTSPHRQAPGQVLCLTCIPESEKIAAPKMTVFLDLTSNRSLPELLRTIYFFERVEFGVMYSFWCPSVLGVFPIFFEEIDFLRWKTLKQRQCSICVDLTDPNLNLRSAAARNSAIRRGGLGWLRYAQLTGKRNSMSVQNI